MQFSVHINPLPRPDRAKLPLQLFSITENMAGGRGRGGLEYRDGSLWEQLVHSSAIGSFPGSRQLYLLCEFRLGSFPSSVPVQARKICAVVHGPVYARDHLTINEIKNSITLELQADTEAEAGPVPVPKAAVSTAEKKT